jgi:hypothetical protein
MIYAPNYMNIDTGFQAILRFFLRNLNNCIVDIADGKELRSASLRWVQGT